jgi:hypothetical protein
MLDSNGQVTVNEHSPSQRFHRYVSERMKDWMRERELDGESAGYEVAFFDEDSLGEVSCLVIFQNDGEIWRAWETADNPRLALQRCLENLRPESEIDESDVAASLQKH